MALTLRQLRVRGYRSIRDLRLELSNLNVIAGANGTGKTNVYRALLLLHAAATGTLARVLAEEGGIPSVVWAGPRKKEPLRVALKVTLDDLDFEMECGPVPIGPDDPTRFRLDPEVKDELASVHDGPKRHVVMERKGRTAFIRDADGKRQTFPATLWEGESILSQLSEPHRFPLLSTMAQTFAAWRFYHHFPSGPDAPARSPQVTTRTPVLATNGADLACALQTILEIGDAPGLNRAIAAAFDGAELNISGDTRLSVQLAQPGLMRPLEAAELSDGTLRYLCLLAALYSPRPPPLLVLNEPETSLHPNLLRPLADQVIGYSKRGQVILTTHAEEIAGRLSKVPGTATFGLGRRDGETVVET